MKRAVCVLLMKDNKVLGVSRKDNHNDFGLVGGKIDDTDPTPEFAAIREAKEETGLDIYNLQLIDTRFWGGYQQHCYIAEYSGFINYDKTKETHVVEWLPAETIMEGSFGEYNIEMFKLLGIIK